MTLTFRAGQGLSFHELNRLAAAVDGSYLFPNAAGGAVTASAGLTVAVAAITGSLVTINSVGQSTNYAGGTVTAGAASGTLTRIDTVYYDGTATVAIAPGTGVLASTTVFPVPPTLTAGQIALGSLWIGPGATAIAASDIDDRRASVSGSKKTTGGGYFMIPAGPADGTSVAQSASANTYGSWVEMIASTSAAIFVVGVLVQPVVAAQATRQYVQVDIGTGAGGAESSVGEAKFDLAAAVAGGGAGPWSAAVPPIIFPAPIPVAISTRIACRTASDEASANDHQVSLICINQADLVTF